MQKAYEAFKAKLGAYNKSFLPAHVPELLLNTPVRLGRWCLVMLDLYRSIEDDPEAHCPADLMAKAYWWADRVAGRMGKDRFSPRPPPADIHTVIGDLAALSQFCLGLSAAAAIEIP
jgi:hypothetical protein